MAQAAPRIQADEAPEATQALAPERRTSDTLTLVPPESNAEQPAARPWMPTLETVWLGLAAVAAALACALMPMEPIDYWWSVRLGALIRQLGALPLEDPLVYTPVRPALVDGQRLARIILSTLH